MKWCWADERCWCTWVVIDSDQIVLSLQFTPKGGWGCLKCRPLSGISGLSFDSPFLSPLVLFFCLVLLLCLVIFLLMFLSPDFFPQKTLKYFSLRVRLFCMALVEQLPLGIRLLAPGVFKPSCSTLFTLFLRLDSVYRPFQLYFIPKTLSTIPPFSAPFLQLIST